MQGQNPAELLCSAYSTIAVDKTLSLTVIGVTTRELLTTTQADNVAALDVIDSVDAVRKVYEEVKSKGPVLLLSHSRHQTDRQIATALPDLAAIIGGHDQIFLSPYREVGRVPVFRAFEKGRYLGRIDLEIEAMLNRAVRASREDEDGGFLQVSGISFEVYGRKVKNIRVGEERKPLKESNLYTVALPDFLSTGGDGYAMLKGKIYVKTGLPLRELLVDTIRQRKVIVAKEEGRIRRLQK